MVFESAIFGDRAPDGHFLMRVLLGGGVDSDVSTLSESALKELVLSELAAVTGISAPPSYWKLVRWKQAIPQGSIGHRARRKAIEAACARLPGLELAGTGVWGIGVEKAVSSGFTAANRLADAVKTTKELASAP